MGQMLITEQSMEIAGLTLLGALLLTAVWHDVRSHRIPNAIVFSGTALALLFQVSVVITSTYTWTEFPLVHAFLTWLGGLSVGLCALLPLYLLRGAAAGDAKLMGMVGAFLGPTHALGAVLSTFVVGAVLAILIAVRAGVFSKMLRNIKVILFGAAAKLAAVDGPEFDAHTDATAKVPYALAIALGTATWLALRYVS